MPTKRDLPDLWRGGAPFDAFRDLSRLQRRIDRMFEDIFWPTQGQGTEESFNPACDLEETEQNYLLSFDLPGMKKDDLKIEIRENQLTVSGERKQEERKREKNRISTERYYGSFIRSFTLPGSIDSSKVEASYEDGVLRISMPKTAASSSKQIPIREGKLLGKAA